MNKKSHIVALRKKGKMIPRWLPTLNENVILVLRETDKIKEANDKSYFTIRMVYFPIARELKSVSVADLENFYHWTRRMEDE